MERYPCIWKKVLQNLSGKTMPNKEYARLADLLNDFNDLYVCEVTFSTTPSGATIVVKDSSGNTISARSGKYYLKEGSYTYTASAEGYETKENQSLTISNSDEQTGTKTVTVTLNAVQNG